MHYTAKQIQVTKIEVAERQLKTAVDLHFRHGDVVAIHALAAAAHEVLRTLAKDKGVATPTFQQAFLDQVQAGQMKGALTKLNEARNFFKHADRDPGAILSFNPWMPEWELFDAIRVHFWLTNIHIQEFDAFVAWWHVKHAPSFSESIVPTVEIVSSSIVDRDRSAFLDKFIKDRKASAPRSKPA